jgi:hypothetical protein
VLYRFQSGLIILIKPLQGRLYYSKEGNGGPEKLTEVKFTDIKNNWKPDLNFSAANGKCW